MPLVLEKTEDGRVVLHQSFDRPVVYLDHWAVRLFSDNPAMQDRLVAAIKGADGSLLFSTHNLAEFCALNDMQCAKRAEALLDRAMPNLYLVDMTADPEFRPPTDVPPDVGPNPYWLLDDLAARAQIAGKLTVHRFVTDAVQHSEELLPVFKEVAGSIANAINTDRADAEKVHKAKMFRPGPGMNADLILMGELLRDVYLNPCAEFSANDANDLIHAVPTLLRCDYVLLDTKWSHKAQVASRRLRKFGFRGRLAPAFSAKADGVGQFLRTLEAAGKE
jgi:hypothetical protein